MAPNGKPPELLPAPTASVDRRRYSTAAKRGLRRLYRHPWFGYSSLLSTKDTTKPAVVNMPTTAPPSS